MPRAPTIMPEDEFDSLFDDDQEDDLSDLIIESGDDFFNGYPEDDE